MEEALKRVNAAYGILYDSLVHKEQEQIEQEKQKKSMTTHPSHKP